jgi:hypothetical protein
MYSPKIREELIPQIYRAAKGAKLPMTAWVNQAIEVALRVVTGSPVPESEQKEAEVSSEPAPIRNGRRKSATADSGLNDFALDAQIPSGFHREKIQPRSILLEAGGRSERNNMHSVSEKQLSLGGPP